MFRKDLDDFNIFLLKYSLCHYLNQIQDTKDDIIMSFSEIPSGNILSMMWKLGVNLKKLGGKNIMSVGEGVPFLVGSLSKMGANVTAVDPLYENGPGYIYDSLNSLFSENDNAFSSIISETDYKNKSIKKQINRMKHIVDEGKDTFHKNFFENSIKFNGSTGDNIQGVENGSQDYVILSFLINNLFDDEDVGYVLGEGLSKLKKGGTLIIIGPQGIKYSYTTANHLDNLKKKYSMNRTYNYGNNDEYIGFAFIK